MDSCLQATQLEPGLLRYAELLQGVLWGGQHNMSTSARATPVPSRVPHAHLAGHLLDLIPIEDEAPAHELVAGGESGLCSQGWLCLHPRPRAAHAPPGSTKSPHPLLTLLLATALKVVLPLRILDEACRGRGPVCPCSLPPPPTTGFSCLATVHNCPLLQPGLVASHQLWVELCPPKG